MTTFYFAAAAIAAVALLVLLRPWWQSRFSSARSASEADSMRALNTAIYRDQLTDLERDKLVGQLADADYTEARDELQRRLLDDTRDGGQATTATAVPATSTSSALWIALALLIPTAGAGLYAVIGKPDAMLTVEQQNTKAAASLEKMVVQLARRMEEKPDNPEGWAMLARSYGQMGRWDDAEKAFERIGPALQQNPSLLTAYAELLLEKTQGDFSGRPRAMVAAALALEPEHMHALYLSGADAMQAGRWAEVVARWTPLLKQLEPESDDANAITAGLDRAKKELARVGAGGTAVKAESISSKTISGRVELAPALRSKAKPGDIVFLFARAEGGPRMPLAALRLTVADLPYTFTLSDRNALGGGGAKLSEAQSVLVEAKVAKGGTPTAAPGDLSGTSKAVKPGTPGAKGLRIVIDTEVQ